MFLCPEADLGFTDQEFQGRSRNSDSGVVVTFDNTRRRGNRPRMLTTMHAHALAGLPPRSVCCLGSRYQHLESSLANCTGRGGRELEQGKGGGIERRGREEWGGEGREGEGRGGKGRGGVGHGAPRLSENHLL